MSPTERFALSLTLFIRLLGAEEIQIVLSLSFQKNVINRWNQDEQATGFGQGVAYPGGLDFRPIQPVCDAKDMLHHHDKTR